MRQVTDVREWQDRLYAIMCQFGDFCKAHGLRYQLFGGTLLGAVCAIRISSPGTTTSIWPCPARTTISSSPSTSARPGPGTRLVTLPFTFAKITDTRTRREEGLKRRYTHRRGRGYLSHRRRGGGQRLRVHAGGLHAHPPRAHAAVDAGADRQRSQHLLPPRKVLRMAHPPGRALSLLAGAARCIQPPDHPRFFALFPG